MPQVEDWQNRPLDEVYPILYIDAIHYFVRGNGMIRKLAPMSFSTSVRKGKKKCSLSVLGERKLQILAVCAEQAKKPRGKGYFYHLHKRSYRNKGNACPYRTRK